MPETNESSPAIVPSKKHNAVIITLIGIIIALCGIVGFLSAGVAVVSSNFRFITYIFAYPILFLFGFAGYWLIYPCLVFIGFLIFFRSKLQNVKFSIKIIGGILLFLSLLVIVTEIISNSTGTLNISNAWDTFLKVFNDCAGTATSVGTGFMLSYELSGGVIGYLLAGLMDTVSNILTWVVSIVLSLSGLVMIFFSIVKKAFVSAKKKAEINKQEKDAFDSIKNDSGIEESPLEITKPEVKTTLQREDQPLISTINQTSTVNKQSSQPMTSNKFEEPSHDTAQYDLQMKSFNRTQGLVKAHFYREGDLPKDDGYSEFTPNKLSIDDEKEEAEVEVTPSANRAKNETIKDLAFVKTTIGDPEKQMVRNSSKPEVEAPKIVKHRKYVTPPLDLLMDYDSSANEATNIEVCNERIKVIDLTYQRLGVGAHVTGFTMGPSVTRFDIQPDDNVPVSNLSRYVPDLSRALSGVAARFEPVVMGKTTAGLEIPNATTSIVGYKGAIKFLIDSKADGTAVVLGKSITGEYVKAQLEDFPHMLVAGTTGSGKSVFMHTIIMSLIMRNSPDQVRLLLIDPKMVEMAFYENDPHLLRPVICDSTEAKNALDKLVEKMNERYALFREAHCQKLKQYNEYAKEHNLPILPYVVVIFDEYADVQNSCKDIQRPIAALGGKARAAGIHLIISTQRPSVDVINGVIKSNLPTRIALSVSSDVDSMVILDKKGAESLLGYGDMLVSCTAIARNVFLRLQGMFISNKEISAIVDYIAKEWPAEFDPDFVDLSGSSVSSGGENSGGGNSSDDINDDLFDLVKESVMTREYASISSIQREFSVGYNRAGRLFLMLKNAGIVAQQPESASSAKGCKVLVHGANYGKNSENPGSSDLVKSEIDTGNH